MGGSFNFAKPHVEQTYYYVQVRDHLGPGAASILALSRDPQLDTTEDFENTIFLSSHLPNILRGGLDQDLDLGRHILLCGSVRVRREKVC